MAASSLLMKYPDGEESRKRWAWELALIVPALILVYLLRPGLCVTSVE
jgi:hypothetical protein